MAQCLRGSLCKGAEVGKTEGGVQPGGQAGAGPPDAELGVWDKQGTEAGACCGDGPRGDQAGVKDSREALRGIEAEALASTAGKLEGAGSAEAGNQEGFQKHTTSQRSRGRAGQGLLPGATLLSLCGGSASEKLLATLFYSGGTRSPGKLNSSLKAGSPNFGTSGVWGQRFLCLGEALCTVGCSPATLASIH